jgi:hypothetical protein
MNYKDQSGDLGSDCKIILKWILNNWDVRACTGFQ